MGIMDSLVNQLLNGVETDRSYPPRAQNGPQQIPHPPTMTVENDIAVPKKKAVRKTAPNKIETKTKPLPEATDKNPRHFGLTSDELIRGIILSEIIGKPVSKRHGFGSPGSYKTR